MARIALLLILILAGIPRLRAQAPVPRAEPRNTIPDGEPAPIAWLSGTIHGPSGDALAAVPVSVQNARTTEEFSSKTNANGEFRFYLQFGRYTVSARADGFLPAFKDVNLASTQETKIDLRPLKAVPEAPSESETGRNPRPGEIYLPPVHIGAGGASVPAGEFSEAGTPQTPPHANPTPPSGAMHIPAGEPAIVHSEVKAGMPPGDVPIPAGGAVAVPGWFATWPDLAAWVNGQSGRNLRLQAILSPAQAHENMFVWIAHAGADQDVVVPADDIASSGDLQNILKAYPQAAVVGFAWVRDHRFLVLRSNP